MWHSVFWDLYCHHVTKNELAAENWVFWYFMARCLLSPSAKATSKKQNCCFGEAGGTWSTFAPGQLCLGRAPLRLQWSTLSWGVFRQMWRAACDQCHFNFSSVIVWLWTQLTDANLAGVSWDGGVLASGTTVLPVFLHRTGLFWHLIIMIPFQIGIQHSLSWSSLFYWH